MAGITKTVGGAAPNKNRDEVRYIQGLLNKHRPVPLRMIAEDGYEGPETKSAIEEFQIRVMGLGAVTGRVEPVGATMNALTGGTSPAPVKPVPVTGVYSHPDAAKVALTYSIQGDGKQVVELNAKAAHLLKSIIASCGMNGGQLNSTLRTYHDQARITITQTYKKNPQTVATWYGQEVLNNCKKYLDDIQGFATWWEAHDKKRGKVSSKHLSNRAMDVVPSGDREKFAARVKELQPVAGSGVLRIIPKGVMNEPVDHVEFTFDVTG
jgi:peptidoglycan hydrolase-like protein with peptidoglycan-binding domain